MKEFVLRVLHILVYAFELLLHRTKRKVTEDNEVKDKDGKTRGDAN